MVRDVMQNLQINTEIFGIISTVLFVVGFLIIAFFTLRMKKSHEDEMKQMPLDDNELVNPRHKGKE